MSYLEFLPKITSYVRSHVNNYDDSNDIISDVVVKIETNINNFDSSKASLSTWIYTITRNTVCDYYRRESSKAGKQSLDKVQIEDGKDIFVEENLESLSKAFNALSSRERDIIILTYYYGYQSDEIAQKMNITSTNINVIRHRAMEKLRKEMLTLEA